MSCTTPIRTFAEDYATGLTNQYDACAELEKHFGCTYTEKDALATMDYESPLHYMEVKSRTCTYNDFNQTIIGNNKVLFARTAKKPCIFAFTFTDGSLYYIRYDPDKFSRYTVRPFRREARSDYTDLYKDYCYIPVRDLTCVIPPRPLFRN